MKIYTYIHISLCVCVCVCVFVCKDMCVCVCVCVSSICMQIPGRVFHSESGNEPPQKFTGTLLGLGAKKNFQSPDKDLTNGKPLTQNVALSRAPRTASSFQTAELATKTSTLLRSYQNLRDPINRTKCQIHYM